MTDSKIEKRERGAAFQPVSSTYHVATINAFANKFGSWTGAIRNEETREVIRERFPTYDEARNWVKAKAWAMFGPINYASVRRKGEYYANCWSTQNGEEVV